MPKRGSSDQHDANVSDKHAHDGVVPASAIARGVQGIDHRWHHLKYLSLALYSAWILLTMTNNGATSTFGDARSGMVSSKLYLYSGISLAVCLIGAGVLQKQAGKLVENGLFVVLMGLLVSLATYLLSGGVLADDGEPGFQTVTGLVELYSPILESYDEQPLPYYEEPEYSPVSQPAEVVENTRSSTPRADATSACSIPSIVRSPACVRCIPMRW